MFLCIQLFAIVTLLTNAVYTSPLRNIPSIDEVETILSGLKASDESVSNEKEIEHYLKKMASVEKHNVKKILQDQMSKEEKNQMKYYDDLLTQIRALNSKF